MKRGAVAIGTAAVLFATVGALVKHLTQSLPSGEVVFFRSAVGLLLMGPIVFFSGQGFRTKILPQHVVRALSGLAGMYCSFYALARIPLAEATVLGYTAPLFMPAIAKVWLKEDIPANTYPLVFLGFFGVLLVLKPGFGVFQGAALMALASGLLAAVAQVGIRGLTQSEPVVRIVFYFGLISTLIAAGPAAVQWSTPSPALWGWILAMGGLATVAQLFLTQGYRLAPPARVGPFMYAAVLWAGVIDAVIWHRRPDPLSLLGALCVCVSGAWLLRAGPVQKAIS